MCVFDVLFLDEMLDVVVMFLWGWVVVGCRVCVEWLDVVVVGCCM